MKRLILVLALLASPAAAQNADNGPNSEKGRALYAQCAACHSLEADNNTSGPSLKGVVGRKAAGLESYTYSPPMRRATLTWTKETLDAFLTDPQSVVAGTKMPFAGMASATDRADLIAYLESQ